MFFNRRQKETRKFLDLEERTDLEFRFQERLEVIDRLTNADEKILMLEETKAALWDKFEKKLVGISKKAKKKKDIVDLGGTAVGVGGLIGVTIITGGTAPLLAGGVWLAGWLGGAVVSAKAGASTQKHLLKEGEDIRSLLMSQRQEISRIEDEVLAENVETLAKSPLLPEIFKKYPDFKAEFANAAVRKLTESRQAERKTPRPKKAQPGF